MIVVHRYRDEDIAISIHDAPLKKAFAIMYARHAARVQRPLGNAFSLDGCYLSLYTSLWLYMHGVAATPSTESRIGEVLRRVRGEYGSLRSRDTHVRFSPSFLSQVETGRVSPSIESLERIAAVLGSRWRACSGI